MAQCGSTPMPRQSKSRLLCLYGTDAQRQKLRYCVGRRQTVKVTAEPPECKGALQGILHVLGKSWLQELLGCSRVPHALSQDVFHTLRPGQYPGSPEHLCLNCSVQDKLHRALRHLQRTHLETEKATEALAEQYASLRKHVTTVQRTARGEVERYPSPRQSKWTPQTRVDDQLHRASADDLAKYVSSARQASSKSLSWRSSPR